MFLSIDQLKYMLDGDAYINELLQDKSSLIIPQINHTMMSIGVIDLSVLDIKMRAVLLKWILSINKSRIQKGLSPVVTLELIKRCPLWQFINIPYKNLDLTKESFNSNKKPRGFLNKASTKRYMR